jgi:hypothetical protein
MARENTDEQSGSGAGVCAVVGNSQNGARARAPKAERTSVRWPLMVNDLLLTAHGVRAGRTAWHFLRFWRSSAAFQAADACGEELTRVLRPHVNLVTAGPGKGSLRLESVLDHHRMERARSPVETGSAGAVHKLAAACKDLHLAADVRPRTPVPA